MEIISIFACCSFLLFVAPQTGLVTSLANVTLISDVKKDVLSATYLLIPYVSYGYFIYVDDPAEGTVACHTDYMPRLDTGSQQKCVQRIWRDFQLSRSQTAQYTLPDPGMGGWTLDTWRMCLNATLGTDDKTFAVKFLGSNGRLAMVKVNYGQTRKSTVVMTDFEDGAKTGQNKTSVTPAPLTAGSAVQLTAELSQQQMKYTLCGQTCVMMKQNVTDTDLQRVQFSFDARVSQLNMWCV